MSGASSEGVNRRQFLAAGAGAIATLAGCSTHALPTRPTGSWFHRGNDARNTGASDAAVPARATPAWTAGAARTATPLADDGVVFSVADAATALDARTGAIQWRTPLGGPVDYTPALTDDALLVATADRLVSLSRASGEERWSKPLPRQPNAALTAADGVVTVPTADAGVLAYDGRNGSLRWHERMRGPTQTALAGGVAYASGYRRDGDSAVLRAVDAATGERRWEVDLSHPDAPPVRSEAGLLVCDAGSLDVRDPADGARQRTLGTFGDLLGAPPAVAEGDAYVTSSAGDVVALSVADGSIRWRADVGVMAGTGVTVGREAALSSVQELPTAGGPGIVAFERADGTPRWEHRLEGLDVAAGTSAVPLGGAVLVVTNVHVGVLALGDHRGNGG